MFTYTKPAEAVAVVRSPLWTGDDAEDLWQAGAKNKENISNICLF